MHDEEGLRGDVSGKNLTRVISKALVCTEEVPARARRSLAWVGVLDMLAFLFLGVKGGMLFQRAPGCRSWLG